MCRIALPVILLIVGCGKRAGPTNFVRYDVPAGDLGGMTPYAEPIPGLEMGVAEGWKGFSGPALYAAIRRANPSVQGIGMNVQQNDQVMLLDYRPAIGSNAYVPLLRMNAYRQKNESLEDAVAQFLAHTSVKYRRLPDARLPGGVAAHLAGIVDGTDLFENKVSVPAEVWLFASADRLYVVQDAYETDQTGAVADVGRMLATLRFRRPDPRGGFGKPPMPETDAGITSSPMGQMMGGRPYDPNRDDPRGGYAEPPMPPTFGPPQPSSPPSGAPPGDPSGTAGSVDPAPASSTGSADETPPPVTPTGG